MPSSLLQALRSEERSYTEIADALRAHVARPNEDVRELWRRLVFNLLITNTDDHLWNLGVLYAGDRKWQLAPAFDLNPFPDKQRESKTWLSERTGPITWLAQGHDGSIDRVLQERLRACGCPGGAGAGAMINANAEQAPQKKSAAKQ
jgi:hypothetical protein